MEIKNRLFPYPVLCDELDDYVEGGFESDVKLIETINDLKLSFIFKLDNPEIEELIRIGKAKYVVHLECSYTSFRKAIKTDLSEIDFLVPKNQVNRELYVLVMIVTTDVVEDFFSEYFNEDYMGETIRLDASSIIAYKNLSKILITKDYEELAGNESLFSIIRVEYPDADAEHMVDVQLDEDRIKIRVDAKTYDAYLKFQQSTAVVMSLFVLPAILYMIDDIREAGTTAEHESKKWFQKMQRFYKSQGLDFEYELLNSGKNSVELGQEMLKLPIGKAYKELLDIGD